MIWGRFRVPSHAPLSSQQQYHFALFSKSSLSNAKRPSVSLSLVASLVRRLTLPSFLPSFPSLCITISIPLSSTPATLLSLAHWCCNCESSPLTSDLSLTNSLETSSLVLWDNIRRMVSPVSSMWMRRPSASQHAHEPCKRKGLLSKDDTAGLRNLGPES